MNNVFGIGRGNRMARRMRLFGSNDDDSDPRSETFWSFSKSFCCPNFTFKSATFIISCLDVIIYITTLLYGGIKMTPTELLAPTSNTLDSFGMKYPIKIQSGQVWRLITFGLLHANFSHITMNLFTQIIFGSIIEHYIGTVRFIILYIASNIGGGIFSCTISSAPGVGASVAIYGILGAYITYTLMNWNALDEVYGNVNKYTNILFMSFMILLNLSVGFTNPIIDNWGHLGGLIFGFFLMWVIEKPQDVRDGCCCEYKYWFWISVATLSILYIGLTVIVFNKQYI